MYAKCYIKCQKCNDILLLQIEMLPLAKYITSKIVPDVAESLMQYSFCNQTNEISFCWYIFSAA